MDVVNNKLCLANNYETDDRITNNDLLYYYYSALWEVHTNK